ncbi:unnamed protein product, partial [Allacma fusca]
CLDLGKPLRKSRISQYGHAKLSFRILSSNFSQRYESCSRSSSRNFDAQL